MPNATPESWIEYCNYTYNVHLVLSDPPPPEGPQRSLIVGRFGGGDRVFADGFD